MRRALLAAFAMIVALGVSGAGACELEYTFSAADPAARTARVTARMEGCGTGALGVSLPGGYGAEEALRIDALAAHGPEGEAIRATRRGPGAFTLDRVGSGAVVAEYALVMDQTGPLQFGGRMGYMNERYVLGRASWAFIVPEGIVPERMDVRFVLPEGWGAVTPWARGEGHAYTTDDYAAFAGSTFAAGRFELRERQISGTRFAIALGEGFDAEQAGLIFEQCFGVAGYLKGLFNVSGPESHLSIFVRLGAEDERQYYNEGRLSHGAAVSTVSEALLQMEHRLFHTFNAFIAPGEAVRMGPGWIVEGMDEYYLDKALLAIRHGMPMQRLRAAYAAYLEAGAGNTPPLGDEPYDAEPRSDGEYMRHYQKGALAAALLDSIVMDVTRGRASLDQVLGRLYGPGGPGRGSGNAELLDALEAVTGRDMGEFFALYVEGTEELPMGPLLADADTDGLVGIAEQLLGSNPDAFDTDRDGASDLAEYRAGTGPADAGATPAGPVHVDGGLGDWVGALVLREPRAGAACHEAVTAHGVRVEGGALYVAFALGCPASVNPDIRYFLNVDADADGRPELHFGAQPGSDGDMHFFAEDLSTYGYRSMAEVGGLESAAGPMGVEFRVPVALVGSAGAKVYVGVWDNQARDLRDGAGWLDAGGAD